MGALKQYFLGLQDEYDGLLDEARRNTLMVDALVERLCALAMKLKKLCDSCPVCGALTMNGGVCYRCRKGTDS